MTLSQNLREQSLELLDATPKELVVDVHRNDTDRLLINGEPNRQRVVLL